MKTFLTAQWQNIIMANYEIEPSLLEAYLPKGVTLDYFQGKTYISLVGFLFKKTAIFGIPIPYLGTFEEVNLRFYVVRKEGENIKRGVVFINETVPNKLVAFIANKLYKEHYIATPTKHTLKINEHNKDIKYTWLVNKKWNNISVNASIENSEMKPETIESYIYEHYYGFTNVDKKYSIEYKINHPSWRINTINSFEIKCDFEAFYGKDFKILNTTKVHSVMIAEGSAVSVDWKRTQF